MNLSFELDRTSQDPLYRQLVEELRRQVLSGELNPGHRLPSTRVLAKRLGVGRVTVSQAYDQLEAEGFLRRRVGAGTFVRDSLPLPSDKTTDDMQSSPVLKFSNWGQRIQRLGEEVAEADHEESAEIEIDFGFGRSFPHIFPYDVWRSLLARYLSTDDVMLSRYGSAAGFRPLRQAIADYLARLRGVNCHAEEVVIVNGAQQALDIIARLLLDDGDEVLVETPGYTDAFAVFRAHGAVLRAVSVDDHGLPVASIPSDTKARLAFVTPANQFPRGGAMSAERRLGLLQWARARQCLVIEDDYDGALRYEGRPLISLQGMDSTGHVIYLGTFSKVLFPALRLGYVVLPAPMQTPFLEAKSIVDRGAPTLTQAAVADFILEGHFERHLRRLRREYGRHRQTLVDAIKGHLGSTVSFACEPAGLHIMLYLEPDQDEQQVVADAANAGVRVYAGALYHLQDPAPPSILLGFSGLNEGQIHEGVDRLAGVLNRSRHVTRRARK